MIQTSLEVRKIILVLPTTIFLITNQCSHDSRMGKHLKEDVNDIIEDKNDDKVNVEDDNNIKHEASLT